VCLKVFEIEYGRVLQAAQQWKQKLADWMPRGSLPQAAMA
jgi:hypothetical protein